MYKIFIQKYISPNRRPKIRHKACHPLLPEKCLMKKKHLSTEINSIYRQYHSSRYIGMDPLVCVRNFLKPGERELTGLLAAGLSYGRVENIISSIRHIIESSDGDPLPYTLETTFTRKKKDFKNFRHRFNTGDDIALLLETVKSAIADSGSLEAIFCRGLSAGQANIRPALEKFIAYLRSLAQSIAGPRTASFDYLLCSPVNGSACKRMNMFLRWMVRCDDGIDLGVWKNVSQSLLVMPVDVHVARVARRFELTTRVSADWSMAEQITESLKKIDPDDPVKYDFSLCRYGMILFRKGHGT
jgi:uncharacterized protein (TIGR02757 family)